jgi:hypothetical protein
MKIVKKIYITFALQSTFHALLHLIFKTSLNYYYSSHSKDERNVASISALPRISQLLIESEFTSKQADPEPVPGTAVPNSCALTATYRSKFEVAYYLLKLFQEWGEEE